MRVRDPLCNVVCGGETRKHASVRGGEPPKFSLPGRSRNGHDTDFFEGGRVRGEEGVNVHRDKLLLLLLTLFDPGSQVLDKPLSICKPLPAKSTLACLRS